MFSGESRRKQNRRKRKNISHYDCVVSQGKWRHIIDNAYKKKTMLTDLNLHYGSRNNTMLAELSQSIMVPPVNGVEIAHYGTSSKKHQLKPILGFSICCSSMSMENLNQRQNHLSRAILQMQIFLKSFDHQTVRGAWLHTSYKVGQTHLGDKRRGNRRLGFGWAETVCNKSQYYSGVPMEYPNNGGMTYPRITHVSHEVGFKFLEMTLPLLQHAFYVAEAVYPGLKKY